MWWITSYVPPYSRVLVAQRVEAVRAVRDRPCVTPGRSSVSTFCSARVWNRYSLPIRRAGSPVHSSRGPRIANDTPARCEQLRPPRLRSSFARSSNEPAHPTQYRYSGALSRSSITRTSSPSAQSARCACGMPHGLPAALEVAEHRPGLGREPRLAPSPGCGAGRRSCRRARCRPGTPACRRRRSCRPTRTSSSTISGTSGDRLERLAGRLRRQDRRALLEQVVPQVHDQQLGRERLARVPCRARALAPPALRARVQVQRLLPREVRASSRRRGALLARPRALSMSIRSGVEGAPRAGAREADVDRARGDVQVLRVRRGRRGTPGRSPGAPTGGSTSTPGCQPSRHPREQVTRPPSTRASTSGRRRVPGRDPRAAREEERHDDQEDQAEDPVGLQPVAPDEPLGALAPAGCRRRSRARRARRPRTRPARGRATRVPPIRGSRRSGSIALPDDLDDRGEQDQEPPEDQRVHQPGERPLEQLALARGPPSPSRATRRGHVAGALDRASEPHEPGEEHGPAGRPGPPRRRAPARRTAARTSIAARVIAPRRRLLGPPRVIIEPERVGSGRTSTSIVQEDLRYRRARRSNRTL